MALIARSIEMSFSASRLRSTLRSMSICLPPVCTRHGVAELKENLSRAELAVAVFALLSRYLQQDRVVAGSQYPALDRGGAPRFVRPGGRSCRQRRADQPARRAAPAPRLGQRPVDTRRGDLQRVRGLAHRAIGVELGCQRPADQRE